MSRAERDKGRKGEAEVAAVWKAAGLEVRGLEASGDHLVICGSSGRLTLHSEAKRQEVARVWLWFEQASREAPAGAVAVVGFRRNRSRWLGLLALEHVAELAAAADWAYAHGFNGAGAPSSSSPAELAGGGEAPA